MSERKSLEPFAKVLIMVIAVTVILTGFSVLVYRDLAGYAFSWWIYLIILLASGVIWVASGNQENSFSKNQK